MTERIAVIDLGSNSARLIVMHVYKSGAYNLVYHQKESVRLGQGLDEHSSLQPEAIDRTLSVLHAFAHMCQLFQVDQILAVATAAVRNARNGAAFIELVRQQTEIPLRVITGAEEAYLGYNGVINTIDVSDALLFDLGGGSMELTLIKDRKPQHAISLPFGAVTLTERFHTQDTISDSQYEELRDYISQRLLKLPWLKNISLPLIGIGGTARNLCKVDQRRKNYPTPKIHNYRMGVIAFNEIWKTLLKSNANNRKKIPGLSSERADIILAGATVIKCLFEATRSDQFIASGCGVREGLFLQHYLKTRNLPDTVPDILEQSTRNILLFYNIQLEHSLHVASMAEALFDGWQLFHHLEPRDRILLSVAAHLHDIGITINYYDHPRHSAYLIENARLFGLTHREQILTALIASWHNGLSAKYVRNRIYNEFLDEADWLKARKMALLLAMAETMDATEMQLIKKVQASVFPGRAYLTLTSAENITIECAALQKHAKWLKKEFNAELDITIRQHSL
ncbi:MAG: ppx 2 [Firmicutes bacterium]|nr:ppx 2 [Bacillota bacterium]